MTYPQALTKNFLPFIVLGLIGLLAGCQSTYFATGPMVGLGGTSQATIDNSDVPWVLALGVDVSDRCSIEVWHLSSVRGGFPFWDGGDDVVINAVHPRCRLYFSRQD